jgi:hypothetical protein
LEITELNGRQEEFSDVLSEAIELARDQEHEEMQVKRRCVVGL